jgi:hypothetical protein
MRYLEQLFICRDVSRRITDAATALTVLLTIQRFNLINHVCFDRVHAVIISRHEGIQMLGNTNKKAYRGEKHGATHVPNMFIGHQAGTALTVAHRPQARPHSKSVFD